MEVSEQGKSEWLRGIRSELNYNKKQNKNEITFFHVKDFKYYHFKHPGEDCTWRSKDTTVKTINYRTTLKLLVKVTD